jgi:histidine triad (HIT) family protein
VGRGGNRDPERLQQLTSPRASCDFCAIARGEDAAAEVVCEGDDWVAFFPRRPATPGHTLIIPREHVEDLWAASPAIGASLMQAAMKVGQAIAAAVDPEGLNLITSAGAAAEQSIRHLHLHVVPRWEDDGFGRIWPPQAPMRRDLKEDVAARIRAECRSPAEDERDKSS